MTPPAPTVRRAAVSLILGASLAVLGTGTAHAHGTFEPPTAPHSPSARNHQGPYSVLHQRGPFSVLHQAR